MSFVLVVNNVFQIDARLNVEILEKSAADRFNNIFDTKLESMIR